VNRACSEQLRLFMLYLGAAIGALIATCWLMGIGGCTIKVIQPVQPAVRDTLRDTLFITDEGFVSIREQRFLVSQIFQRDIDLSDPPHRDIGIGYTEHLVLGWSGNWIDSVSATVLYRNKNTGVADTFDLHWKYDNNKKWWFKEE